jgi:membrane-associated phospholipid phosphatase
MDGMKAIFYDWGGLNVWLFQSINAWHSDWLDRFMQRGSQLAEHHNFPVCLALLSLVAIWASRSNDKRIIRLWIGVFAVFAVGNLVDGWVVSSLKDWFAFPRPPLALPPGSVHVVGSPEINLQHSLPSGHTSFAMLMAASLWPALNRYGKYAAACFVLWVGVSRISLGAHFPADVLAGALSCLLVVMVLRKLFIPAGDR